MDVVDHDASLVPGPPSTPVPRCKDCRKVLAEDRARGFVDVPNLEKLCIMCLTSTATERVAGKKATRKREEGERVARRTWGSGPGAATSSGITTRASSTLKHRRRKRFRQNSKARQGESLRRGKALASRSKIGGSTGELALREDPSPMGQLKDAPCR